MDKHIFGTIALFSLTLLTLFVFRAKEKNEIEVKSKDTIIIKSNHILFHGEKYQTPVKTFTLNKKNKTFSNGFESSPIFNLNQTGKHYTFNYLSQQDTIKASVNIKHNSVMIFRPPLNLIQFLYL